MRASPFEERAMARRRRNPLAKPAAITTRPATTPATEAVIVTTDLDGFLFSLAGRLRVFARALREVAADKASEREADEHEDPRLAMADDLETASRAILAAAGGLCAGCGVRDVGVGVRVGGAAAGKRG